ncbi:MAG: ketoacyl-ACP synthase III [Candidatus Omnitrophica bacterium]|nr:ketoacyl-ACP synthase III [Candidatus Omnitrophota bacterium]MCF7876861.1 ketoacyl-ACP synthase III [Candidatus Omnitrophota bacterium]MCF7877880.1 ketoacyl-ACP synthase III [Candidatus Omnitrophota bacterium]MCF7892572.1 ketoacyl-ACP synthase III [Candidatus Omnitrophota bacterium]
MKSAKIVGLGKYLPPKRLKNSDLEKIVDTSDEWITTRTGIKERRIAAGSSSSELAHRAAKRALKDAGLRAGDLDLIIVASITPDNFFPSTACRLQNLLKARNAAAFDVSAACSGFVYGLTCAWQLIRGELYKNVLVVGSEVLSSITDWQDRSTCVLFGDGAGAAVLTQTNEKSFLSAHLGADGSRANLLHIPAGGSRMPATHQTVEQKLHTIKMKGNELFRVAVRIMVEAAKVALAKAELKTKDLDMLVPHQANKRIIDAVVKTLKIKDKVYYNLSRYGNMSSASCAVALCEAYQKGKVKKGDIVVLDTFGGGLVWGSCVIKWTL